MPISPTYPGVYIEEIPSGVRTIVGVATAITAFIGRAARGPTNEPTRIQGFDAFDRKFGGLDFNSTMSYAVQQFFLNGGVDAIIVRVANTSNAVKATVDAGGLKLVATGEGIWGNQLRVRVDYQTKDPTSTDLFNLAIHDAGTRATETFLNVSLREDDARYVERVLESESVFVRVQGAVPAQRPSESPAPASPADSPFADGKDTYYKSDGAGNDGTDIRDADIQGNEGRKEGIYALEKTDLFNILCIPPLARKSDVGDSTYAAAASYCLKKRAFLLIDPPVNSITVEQGETFIAAARNAVGEASRNAAVFFPRIKVADPKKENRIQEFAPCGAIAGIFARTDTQRGVWKSPAGLEASLLGVQELGFAMTDGENGRLNPLGMNCLRQFPTGKVVWGARTVAGMDRLASEWKYLAVRRLALFIEESLYRGTQWVVFEPNDEPLWAQIRLNVGSFMHDLFRKQAFQGRSPKEAYFVNCSKETTTQSDINLGIVNIHVGFAPLKPAEFVIIKIQQMAGQLET